MALIRCWGDMDCVRLNNGAKMPRVGMGTFPLDGIKVAELIRSAVALGYRHFDTASAYHNEKWVGRGIRFSWVRREELWITTKLSNHEQRAGNVRRAFEDSLGRLGLSYVDLYLMHWPNPGTYLASWTAMEQIYRAGLVRAIGVCNFHQHHLEELKAVAEIIPAVNQVELHPLLAQRSLVDYCEKAGIQVEAYSPVARMHEKLIGHPVLVEIAARHGRTVPQIVLRWDYQNGVVTIPKTASRRRLKENIGICDFCLSDEEMVRICGLDEGFRVRHDPDHCDYSKL